MADGDFTHLNGVYKELMEKQIGEKDSLDLK